MNERLADLFKLSPAERIQLAEDLWDSVAAEQDGVPSLTAEQRTEVERRLSDHKNDPSSALSWQDVRARLWSHVG
jgi:putative addiction module component (TIGR02574 family)